MATDDPYDLAAEDVIGYGDEIRVGLDLVRIRTERIGAGDYRWADPDPQWERRGKFEWLLEARFDAVGERDGEREGWQVTVHSPGADEEFRILSWGWGTLRQLREGRWLCDVENRHLLERPFVAESFMSAFLAPENIEAAIQHACSNPELQAILTADYIKLALES